jgi:phospholipid transport system substrate-binding protein
MPSTPVRLLAGLVLAVATSIGLALESPTARVRSAVDTVLGALREPGLASSERWARIHEVIDRSFDFESMSKSVLATGWQQATAAERARFVEFFSQYLEDLYRTKIENYTGQEIRIGRETIDGDRATVDTVIVSGGTEIPVTYRLHLDEDQWFAYDVVIEGVSLVNNYRSTFSAIVAAEGMDGVLNDLQQRIARYKSRQPDDAAPGAGPR